jgi:PIN domain nuclease of toxin-antitoxin system
VSPGAVLLDTHVVFWWSAEPKRVSKRAQVVLEAADEMAVAAISWYELARMAHSGRVAPGRPLRSWLDRLAAQLRTIALTPAIADAAAGLPSSFPSDPADRLIYATAAEHDLPLVTKDRAIRDSGIPGVSVVW